MRIETGNSRSPLRIQRLSDWVIERLVTVAVVCFFTLVPGPQSLIPALRAQQPTSTAPAFQANSQYLQGRTWADYQGTAGTGLTLNLAAGQMWCQGAMVTYAGGTLTMTNAATNYVYLNPSSSCAPTSNTTGFPTSAVPVATVATSGGAITNVTDRRALLSSASGVSSLGNGTTVVDASILAGADFCAKANAAVAMLAATGGTVDTSGMIGSQTCAADANLYSSGVPIITKLGSGLSLTLAAGVRIKTRDGSYLVGPALRTYGPNSYPPVHISGNTSTNIIDVANSGYANQAITGLAITNSGTGACVSGVSGGALLVEGNAFACKTGMSFIGSYNRIINNTFWFTYAGIVMDAGNNVNSNVIRDNIYMSTGNTGTGVFVRGGYANKFEGKEDCENCGLGYFLAGQAAEVHGAYLENIAPTASWSSATYYSLGAIVKISSSWAAICTAAGTSGGSTPTWTATQGDTVADGSTVTWMMYSSPNGANFPVVLIAPGSMTNVIDGATGNNGIITDLDYVINGRITNQIDTTGNMAWGSAATPPYARVTKPEYGFIFGLNNNTITNNLASFNFQNWNIEGNGLAYYGPQNDSLQCATFGLCGHIPLHLSTLVPSAGISDYGPVSVNPLPTPAAPTVTVVGTPGSTSATYYVVAHCGGGVTLPSAGTTITNAPGTLDTTNYVKITVPTTYTGWNGRADLWSCSWDILKGDTAHSISTASTWPGVAPANRTYSDQGGATTAYSTPTRNSTGDVSVGGVLTTANPIGQTSGGTGLTSAAAHSTLISTGSAWVAKNMPDCTDIGSNHLNYTQSTDTFSCGTSGGGGGGGYGAGDNLLVNGPNLDFNPLDTSTFYYREDFTVYYSGGGSVTGFPAAGWMVRTYGGGSNSVAQQASVWPHLGVVREANAGAGKGSSIEFQGTNGETHLGSLVSNTGWDSVFVFRLNNTAAIRVRMGYQYDVSLVSTTYFGLRYDTTAGITDTHFQFCRTNNDAELCYDTGVAADTNWHKLRMRSLVAGTILLTLDSGAERSICAAGCDLNGTLNSIAVHPFLISAADDVGSVSMDIDLFAFKARGLSR
jgi:hypothetical protein